MLCPAQGLINTDTPSTRNLPADRNPGPADKSYGIQVAKLAGLPKPIIDRAKEILSHLEMNAGRPESKPTRPHKQAKAVKQDKGFPESHSPQMDLFE